MDNIRYCASAFVVNKDKKVLLIFHKKFNKYIQPGGHLMEGETPVEAAIREVFVETNIKFNIIDSEPFSIGEYYNNVGHQIDYQFIGYAIDEEIINNEESFKAGWFGLDELDKIDIVDDLKEKIEFVLNSIQDKEELWSKELLLQKN